MNKIYTNEESHAAKLSCAMDCLQNLQKEYNIDEVYCADDIDFLQEIFRNILKETMGINLNVIIPKYGENNLKFINEEIENGFIKTNIK